MVLLLSDLRGFVMWMTLLLLILQTRDCRDSVNAGDAAQ